MSMELAEQFAKQKFKEHGLDEWILQEAPHFSKSNAGRISYPIKCVWISSWLIASGNVEEIQETILHEIAHALAGEANGHNEKWLAIAKRIGCKDFKDYRPTVKTRPYGKLI